jgi:hypothetical protein
LHRMPSLQEPHTAANANKLPIADFENISLCTDAGHHMDWIEVLSFKH